MPDMFTTIRNRLTFQYTVFTGLALAIFAFVFYFLLSSMLLKEQEQDVLGLAAGQAIAEKKPLEHYGEYEHDDEKRKSEEKSNESIMSNENYFYYVVSENNQIVSSKEAFSELHSQIWEILQTWSNEKTEVISVVSSNGEKVSFMTASVKVYDDNRPIGTVFVGRDMEQYDHIRMNLIKALVLSAFIFILIAALAGHWAAKKALVPIQTAFDTQKQFVADASHELRTPLSVFQASLEVLERKDKEKLSDLSKQVIDDLKDEVRRMTRLVNNLLTLARSDSETIQLLKENIDLGLTAEKVVRKLMPIALNKNIEMLMDFCEKTQLVADKDRMEQLLFVLIDNAIKFTPAGGKVFISIYEENKTTNSEVVIEVKDSGIGMTKEEQKHVFERFYRADKTRSREAGGTGLGLSIAAWIVNAHKGRIHVSSELGKGSKFSVRIPAK